jgi:hypothetical protein
MMDILMIWVREFQDRGGLVVEWEVESKFGGGNESAKKNRRLEAL